MTLPTFGGRILTNMYFKDAGKDDGNTTMDRLFVNHSFGDKTSVVLGRRDLTVFGGLEYDDAFDGAKLAQRWQIRCLRCILAS